MSEYFTSDEARIRSSSWTLVYGDILTLLLTFFIMLFVLMKEAEDNIYRFVDMLLISTQLDLQEYVNDNNLEETITVNRGTKGINLTISSGALFDSGDSNIKEALKPLLEEVGNAVKRAQVFGDVKDSLVVRFLDAVHDRGYDIKMELRVEGHTDNVPISNPEFPSNWELSTQRALNVVKYITQVTGLPEESLSATGYGEFRPIRLNNSDENRSLNRRVEIYIDAELERVDGQ